MVKEQHLANAPIAEAVIEIQVEVRSGFDSRALRGFVDAVAADYPLVQETHRFRHQVKFSADAVVGAGSEVDQQPGFRLKSPDELQVIHIEAARFGFSRLRPYTSWDAVAPEALRLWEAYRQVAAPVAIVRLGVRYLNRFELPEGEVDAARYLTAPIPIAPGLRAKLEGALTRVVLADEESAAHAGVVQSIERTADRTRLEVLLDIDAFRILDGGDAELTGETLAAEIESLRRFKNRIFFSSITEDAARLWS